MTGSRAPAIRQRCRLRVSAASVLLATGLLLAHDLAVAVPIEPDPRTLPWTTLRRLVLENGAFMPPYRPLSTAELVRLLESSSADADATTARRDGAATRAAWLAYFAAGGGCVGQRGQGAASAPTGWQMGGRAETTYDGRGDIVVNDAGRTRARGTTASLEVGADAWHDGWWAGVTARLAGRIAPGGAAVSAPLLYGDWPLATGRPPVGTARRSRGAWRVDWPRAVAGVKLGNWALSAGWMPRSVGPGREGGLTLSTNPPSFPAVTLRRTAPFRWRRYMSWLGPDHLLIRAGQLGTQEVSFMTDSGRTSRDDRPWHLQWLLTWNHTDWLRTTVTHGVMALPRSGTLWPDLPQVLFPLLGATRAESTRGPLTDRIFTLQFEARWRAAPWPLLPAAAGRAYWEYGGEDYLESSIPGVPQISAPASVFGVELVSPAWDLVLEYAELQHPTVLWYSHGTFRAGYSHNGGILGYPVGGGGEAFSGAIRWRPWSSAWELSGRGRFSAWEHLHIPGTAQRDEADLRIRRILPGAQVGAGISWIRETVTDPSTTTTRDDWFVVSIDLQR